MHGHSLVATFAGSPALRMAGVALVIGAVWGPLVLIAFGTGAALLVRPALLPRLAVAGLVWTMAGVEKADRLLVRARRAVSAKWKVAAASVMAASAVVCAKIKARMAAQSDGNLDARANASQFAGGWGTLVGGVNGLVDAIVVPS